MIFNGPSHLVTDMSLTMEASFYCQKKDLTGTYVVEVEKPKPSKEKDGHALTGAVAAGHQNKATGGRPQSNQRTSYSLALRALLMNVLTEPHQRCDWKTGWDSLSLRWLCCHTKKKMPGYIFLAGHMHGSSCRSS
jgi:hypothetical protein